MRWGGGVKTIRKEKWWPALHIHTASAIPTQLWKPHSMKKLKIIFTHWYRILETGSPPAMSSLIMKQFCVRFKHLFIILNGLAHEIFQGFFCLTTESAEDLKKFCSVFFFHVKLLSSLTHWKSFRIVKYFPKSSSCSVTAVPKPYENSKIFSNASWKSAYSLREAIEKPPVVPMQFQNSCF